MKKKHELSRRDFLTGAAVAGASATLATVAGCAPSAESNSNTPAQASDGATAEAGAGSKWSFETPPAAIEESQISETESADVVVVGSGVSGLVTAMSSLDNGLSVILVSASKGGVQRGGSNNAVYSKQMEAAGIPRDDGNTFYRKEFLANFGNADMRKWYKHYHNSEEAMNWLIDIAEADGLKVAVEVTSPWPETDPMYQAPQSHGFYKTEEEAQGGIGMWQIYLIETLVRGIEARGGKIHFETKGEQLIREDNNTGRVSAVICSTKDGGYIKYEGTKAIVLATGDFSRDREMVERYCPQAVPYIQADAEPDYNVEFNIGGLMPGDGQKMGLWVGAAWQKAQPNCMMVGSPMPGANPYAAHTNLMINSKGERFMNEDCCSGVASVTLLHQPDSTCYAIWGSNYAEDGAPWVKEHWVYGSDPYTAEEVLELWASGGNVVADTVEEVISQLGLPENTIETINRYNDLCAKGVDEDFCKSASKMSSISEPPFFGGTFSPAVLTILGGLRTNLDLQVCEEDDTPIEGLYNVGSMIGDMFAGAYTFGMEGINYGANCISQPYVLGKHLAEI